MNIILTLAVVVLFIFLILAVGIALTYKVERDEARERVDVLTRNWPRHERPELIRQRQRDLSAFTIHQRDNVMLRKDALDEMMRAAKR